MATLTVYPDSGTGATTCDSYMGRGGVNEIFTTINTSAGTVADTTNSLLIVELDASTTNNQFAGCYRAGMTFDTSSIGTTNGVTSAILSLYGSGVGGTSFGSPDYHISSFTPANNNSFVAADYTNYGSTSFGTVTNASWNTAAYNDFTFNSSGRAAISKTGISKFGWQLDWQLNNNFTGVWSNSGSFFTFAKAADTAGTTNDPKLTVTYSPLIANPIVTFRVYQKVI